MNHPAELALHRYMDNAANGKSTMSEETIKQVGQDVMDALARQFGGRSVSFAYVCLMLVGQPANYGLKRTSQTALPRPTHSL